MALTYNKKSNGPRTDAPSKIVVKLDNKDIGL